ncbi:hypothetical protein [Exiguobacterium aurantiacum]|uniref:Asparagine synthase (Glutamine-hydrolyzing) n=1 Tax=Exiguobacterium aurantiacum TaxID=33987 RepID=A0ABY5FQ15_9BACL|nr:hypothetical protein [Exiguobacterium aurantiacum]UTT43641.1 hypothetical protein NMQ00_03815 [Exiguobacterium aurantiacum]
MKDYVLIHDPCVPFDSVVENEVFLLGTAWHLHGKPVAEAMRFAYETSEAALLDELDFVAGRYVLFYRSRSNGSLQITQDALGLKSVFYSASSRCLSSHYSLLREITGRKEPFEEVLSLLKRRVTNNMIPGHFTPDRNIHMLTPNQAMDLTTFAWQRIFPREAYEPISVNEAVEAIDGAVNGLLRQVDQRLLVPITAGMDSRSTLALLRCEPHHQYFTYGKDAVKSLDNDMRTAREIARTFRLPHVTLLMRGEFGKMNDEKAFISSLRKVTIRRHSFEIAWHYYNHFDDDYLHIRSNGYEVARRYYRQAFSLPENWSVEGIARTFSRSAQADKDVLALSAQFIEQSRLADYHNYDPYDLYYWEHRMGTWHASLLLESDLAHDSFILINARHILKQLLHVPLEAQEQGLVQKRLIERYAPGLLEFGIN